MSDLLSGIIARAKGPTVGIMPVLPSRYESSYASPDAFEVPGEHQKTSRPAEDIGAKPGAGSTADRVLAAQLPEAAIPAALAAFEGVEPAGPAEVDGVQPVRRDRVPAEILGVRLTEGSRNEPKPGANAPFRAESVAAEPASVYRYKVHPAPAEPRGMEAFPRHREGLEIRRAEPAPPPVEVHVSIGHIELRQTPPSPDSTRKRSATRQHIGLADYLKRRNGETR